MSGLYNIQNEIQNLESKFQEEAETGIETNFATIGNADIIAFYYNLGFDVRDIQIMLDAEFYEANTLWELAPEFILGLDLRTITQYRLIFFT